MRVDSVTGDDDNGRFAPSLGSNALVDNRHECTRQRLGSLLSIAQKERQDNARSAGDVPAAFSRRNQRHA